MSTRRSVRPQPMLVVTDVPASSRWYQAVLGATSGHGGAVADPTLPAVADRALPLGNDRRAVTGIAIVWADGAR